MRHLLAFLFVSCPLAAVITTAQTAQTPSSTQPAASGLQLDAMDRTADPCTDFYQYACGAWLAKNPVPADRSRWGRFEEVQERNNEILRRILEAAAAGRDGEAKKIGDYYGSCMDEAAIDRKASRRSIR